MCLSVIIPTYNESRLIANTIRHVLHYGGPQVREVLVVDGRSEDDTITIARQMGATILVSGLRGRAAQMDYGAKHAAGDILYFVHADTLPPETYADDIIRANEKGWTMGNFRYCFDGGPGILRINAFFTRFRWFFTQGGDRTFFIRKDVYQSLGGYDPKDAIMEEYVFLRKAKTQGIKAVLIPKACIVSSRKYQQNSWLRVQIVNLVVFVAWSGGWVSSQKLKHWYSQWLR